MSTPLLKDFHFFMLGCEAIALDNGCGHGPDAHVINPDAETLEYTEAITFIEAVLTGLAGRTIKDYIPKLLKMTHYEDLEPTEPVLQLIYCGVNDSAKLVLEQAKLAPHEIWIVEHVFNQFFEGELHNRFTKPKHAIKQHRHKRSH